jgi:N-methylhydantoinase A/oxoprolinase/acetone carboxylase beta subunit
MGRYSIGVDIGGTFTDCVIEQLQGLGRFDLSTVKENFFRVEKLFVASAGVYSK